MSLAFTESICEAMTSQRSPDSSHPNLYQGSGRRESGWQSGKKLDFYSSNPGSSPARVSPTKKKSSKTTAQCAFHDLESQDVLKKKYQTSKDENLDHNQGGSQFVIKICSLCL